MTAESPLSEQDESMSLLSVHMGLEGICLQRKASQSLDNMEKQEGSLTTGGRCIALVRVADLLFASD